MDTPPTPTLVWQTKSCLPIHIDNVSQSSDREQRAGITSQQLTIVPVGCAITLFAVFLSSYLSQSTPCTCMGSLDCSAIPRARSQLKSLTFRSTAAQMRRLLTSTSSAAECLPCSTGRYETEYSANRAAKLILCLLFVELRFRTRTELGVRDEDRVRIDGCLHEHV